jgi:serine protease Do
MRNIARCLEQGVTMQLKPLYTALVAAGVLAVGTAGAFSLTPNWLKKPESQGAAPAAAAVAAAEPAAQPAAVPMIAGNAQMPNYRAIVQQFGPAVVGVTVAGTHRPEADGRGLPPGAEDDPFFQFFKGIPGYGQGPRGGNPSQPFRGQGSGFIIGDDGLILTNAHVVRDAKEVTVKLSDRREYSAKVLGTDPVTDVAVLRIDAKDLPVVRLGDPKRLDVGDPVLAIGAPFGFEQTATQGIVSAKGRSLPGDAVVPFIQTDAAVNPGNSGGPLLNASGEVVGIVTGILNPTEQRVFVGIGFAVPIENAAAAVGVPPF